MENPLPIAVDFPNKNIRIEFDAPQADAINANSPNPTGDLSKSHRQGTIIPPHSLLPMPDAPPGLLKKSLSFPEKFDSPASAIGKFFREKSNSVSEALKRISSLTKDGNDDVEEEDLLVKEFDLVGVKVVKTLKQGTKELNGRISFFSRSNCRDCTAVRSFLRERDLSYVEINIDVYPGREKELRERTGGDSVPQLFFNEKLIGGLAALNSLRNGGMLEAKSEEILGTKCPDDAPAPPVYGFDEEGDETVMDEMAEIVKIVRQRVPIQDRITKMKFVKNCFSGAELVEELIHQLDCGRKKAVEIGKQLARRHFIHHVFGDNEFEDGNHFYRFLEHEPFIPKCYNFRGVVNDSEPKDAAAVSRRLTCIMSAIVESYASDDRLKLDYLRISNSEEFRRYVNVVEDLQRIDLLTLSHDEKLAFFLNLHNSMAIHAVIRIGHPGGMIDRRPFFSDFMYVIGGHPYSLNSIRNGILRSNRRPPFSLIKPFTNGDKRLELSLGKVNELIHFGMWNATRGSPRIRFFRCEGIESELKKAAREYFEREDGVQVDLARRRVYLPRIIKWYSADFCQEKQLPNWIINYLDASKAGLLTHLLSYGGSVNIAYQDYDWSLNL
ncbi:uncharacterized protein LOC121753794 [Salvia splendens]|nr:uncharacterized protein LOC121753794 [Salvia splendens]